ncbi:MAG: hypothetical protein WDZ85_00125 [Candidatus Paceibacterota bacterium]
MKVCAICQKGSIVVGGYSNRIRATKYNPTGKTRKKPNLQKTALSTGGRALVCTNCLKKNRHLTTK